MRNKYTSILTVLLLLFLIPAFAQNKKSQVKKKPVQKHQGTKPAPKADKVKETQKDTRSTAVINFTPEQIESFKQQSSQLVKFFEGTLNFLADKRNPVKEKQTIVTSSYLKSFWDDKVQVEDDLDEKRLVSLYKDIPAYLTDVDFFFKRAKFTYTVQEVSVMTNDIGQTYFKVTANRTLTGLTVNDDSVNSNKVRYIEINYDDSKQQLKIVSIYTTKLNEQNDMRNWWNALPQAWKDIFGKDIQVDAGNKLNQVTFFSDSLSTVNGAQLKLDAPRIYPVLTNIITMGHIDLSGNTSVTDLTPLGKLSGLKEVNLSGTPVSDLMPLKNLNDLEELDISNTQVVSLEPLRYSNHIKILKMKGTKVPDLEMIGNFSDLSELDISNTPVTSLLPLKDLTSLRDLRFSATGITDLTPLKDLANLTMLYFSDTKVEDLSPLAGLKNLQVMVFDNTNVKSLVALENAPQLIRIFCDKSKVQRADAIQFMVKHPEILVIFASEELQKWWTGMSPEWKKVFNQYRKIDASPTSEQLHRLATIDSISINGRASINSLAPVAELSELRTIEFASTGITDLTPLKELKKLTFINAANSKITDVSPLSLLDNLKILVLDNTGVGDIKPLLPLKNLKFIYADNTGVKQAEANGFMDGNSNCLVISQTYENTGWWNSLSKPWQDNLLKQLNITGKPEKEQLQQIAGLEKVTIAEDPQINDLEAVTGMSRLKELEFSDTRVTTLVPLSRTRTLTVLRFSKNPVSDLTPISSLLTLKELDFSNTQVEDLVAIERLVNLETLKFSGTPVKNLKYIQNLRKLKVVEFYNTRISNLDVFDTMSGLKSLKMFNTKVSAKKVEKFKATHPGCEVIFY